MKLNTIVWIETDDDLIKALKKKEEIKLLYTNKEITQDEYIRYKKVLENAIERFRARREFELSKDYLPTMLVTGGILITLTLLLCTLIFG